MRTIFIFLLVLGTVTTAAQKKSKPVPPVEEESNESAESARLEEKSLDEIMPKTAKDSDEDSDKFDDGHLYQACTGDTDSLCECEVETMNCRNIDFEDSEYGLRTANLKIKQKGFIPYVIDLSDNDIGKLHTGKIVPGSEDSVSELIFTQNRIAGIDATAFKNFKNLTKLYLNNNFLKHLKQAWFESLGKTLHKLDLSNNRFTDIPDGMFASLKNLRTLTLDNNSIKALRKEMFKGLDNLESLSIDGCFLSDLPGDIFEYMPKLKGISMRNNKFTEMPRALSNVKNLQTLDISGNALAEIHDNAFGTLQKLEEIYMEEMPYLTVIRDCAFCGLVNLQKLSACNNSKLMELHPNAFGFIESEPAKKVTKLQELSILACNLTTLSEHMLDYSTLTEFKYSSNPWNCTCDLEFLIGEQAGDSADHFYAKCAYPKEFESKTLYSLQPYQVCNATRQAHKVSRMVILFFLFLIVIFVSIGCFLLVTTGKLSDMLRKVHNIPEVSYSNLTNRCEENIVLEDDFEARPAQV